MNDKTKSTLTTAYMMFVFEFADPSSIDEKALKEKLGYSPLDIFHSQRRADSAKQLLGRKEFASLLALYFGQFQTRDGFNYESLDQAISDKRKVFERHLGKDKLKLLSVIIQTMKSLEKPKRGLLGVA